MNKEDFIKEITQLNIEVNEEKLKKLDKYYNLLINWNEKINLTAITKYEEVYLKHFYDSLTLVKAIDLTNESLCDLGTGAGFPGIVIKIFFPSIKVVLVESLTKRTKFLEIVIKELNLKDIEVVNERAEIYAKNNRNKFDIVTARAVTKLNILLEIAAPLLKISGHFIAVKGSCEEEIQSLNNAIKNLNCSINKVIQFNLPFEISNRTLVDIIKNNYTLIMYPRNFDKIKKNPL